VSGNPPYVRQEILGQEFKEYAKKHYAVYHGVADLYTYFIEKGVSLLREGGQFSYIVANKWMRANYGKPLRAWLKEKRIEEIVDFGDLPVFQTATTYPCIVRVSSGIAEKLFSATHVTTLNFPDLEQYIQEKHYSVVQSGLNEDGWALIDIKTNSLMEKLQGTGAPLGDYVNNQIFFGIKTGLNKAFLINSEIREKLITSDPRSSEIIKPILPGRDIKRYSSLNNSQYLILFEKGWTDRNTAGIRNKWKWLQENYSELASYLEPYSTDAEKRTDKGDYWWELRACDYYDAFERPKIIFPDMAPRGYFTLDEEGKYYCLNSGYIIPVCDKYLLGILNSKVFSFYYGNISSSFRGGYLRFFTQYMEKLPIRTIDPSNPSDVARHDHMVTLVEQMLDLNKKLAAANLSQEKEMLKRRIDATDAAIDRLVYELYGLTEDEVGVVEGAV